MSWSVGVSNVEKGGLDAALDEAAAHITDENSRRQYETARDAALELALSLEGQRVGVSLSGHAATSEGDKNSLSLWISEA